MLQTALGFQVAGRNMRQRPDWPKLADEMLNLILWCSLARYTSNQWERGKNIFSESASTVGNKRGWRSEPKHGTEITLKLISDDIQCAPHFVPISNVFIDWRFSCHVRKNLTTCFLVRNFFWRTRYVLLSDFLLQKKERERKKESIYVCYRRNWSVRRIRFAWPKSHRRNEPGMNTNI